ncbi:hypothetical protein CAPNMURICA_68 [Arthrobacter phage CapnMurica]|uniref:Uncharacterized protein n=2 Tax=Gordonvirus captnmurica TaxID=1982153 RepID=A0A386KSI2_9CAUD|nr:hypothetical protein FDH68_gp68 [Arthrobacter phage CaptnMurica]ALY08668.1 hypothetical protein CAPNMURICA_68 [Arthrobacter phage CaptnMurica]AYD87277.1 hypothetical protein SEA_TENNO_70 [Arthrobacter phage Tenno]
MEFITIECSNLRPHKAHEWREGFLWHRKRKCGGYPDTTKKEWLQKNHRHYMVYMPVHSDQIIMVWRCSVPGCSEAQSKFRSAFRFETLGVNKVKRPTVIYKKQML